MKNKVIIVVPWHNQTQIAAFRDAWKVTAKDKRFVFQNDVAREGCAVTKNRGIQAAIQRGAQIVIVLDDDCFPFALDLREFIDRHLECLEPTSVTRFKAVTNPASRGTPYGLHTTTMPVAASMGFWADVGDYDAPAQLIRGAYEPMSFDHKPIFGQYFPLCGMNLAFRPREWGDWCRFVNIPRFDDIWMGWLWQKEAYRRGYCFNLNGPTVRHIRQSNVWANLRDEAKHLERNETLWRDIALSKLTAYNDLLKLLPI